MVSIERAALFLFFEKLNLLPSSSWFFMVSFLGEIKLETK